MTTTELRHPGVRFPPPILFVIGTALGWLLDRALPLPVSAAIPPSVRVFLGWAAVGLGGGVLGWAMLTFVRARTAIYPNQPAKSVVATGPYRYSRNPMYVALSAIMVGVGLLVDTTWIIALVPAVLTALTVLVIRREEAYLSSAFGDGYLAYKSKVRRWL